ncbi:alpha/beta hydrolase [Pseudoalteromonas sp. DL2-H2.2]|uniref:alpha/beta fold hydrolase n=1 Tax=Pseudoalteromonas sp. DL2-H2.2 TaxID=2908889 RepID=UPI001F1BCA89|nr:alpha/beta hydrolase [Pseudoalteromonas sp. DL2-H2.2]MCF2910447.1 alpha/beta hydrolase [Pseudoalteromonas sp. DL2-H2.2]
MKSSIFLFFVSIFLTHFTVLADSKVSFATTENIQLEYIDIGAGDINIIIESGIGMGVDYWKPLLTKLKALKHRVIIYSRAGNGRSTAATDVSIQKSNKRLHALMKLLNIDKNIILVGHSYGGIHVREYITSYRDQVIGLVLLDPSHEKFSKKLTQLNKAWASKDDRKLNSLLAKSQEWKVLQEIYKNEKLKDKGSITKIPTVIVTSSKLGESDWWIGHSEQGKEIWRELHSSLIRHNPNSIHIVSNSTGHNIPIDSPSLVNIAIEQAVNLVNGL